MIALWIKPSPDFSLVNLQDFFLQTPLSPNMITILSLFIGLISAVFFSSRY